MVTAQKGAADRGLSHLPWELRANCNFTFLNTPSLKRLASPDTTQHICHFLRTPLLLFPLPGVLPPPTQDPFHTDCFFESFRFQLKCHLFRKAHQPHPLKMVPLNNVDNRLLIASPHFVIILLSFYSASPTPPPQPPLEYGSRGTSCSLLCPQGSAQGLAENRPQPSE